MTMPPPSPISSLLATLFLFLVSSTILNDYDYGGIIISVDASRAYPHGCLYRHPSYYTYDERDDISWFTGGQNHHHHHDGELTTTTTSLTSETVQEESEFSDYRFLPPASHPIRRSYHQYKLLRRLGAGKFSNVFEAVDILAVANAAAAAAMKKKRKKKIASIQEDATNNETTDTSSSDNESSITTTSTTTTTIDTNTLVVLKCLKPISERKIRRELLVLTHCRDLPNLARLIGIVIPSSMDGDEKMKKKNEKDGEMEVEVMKKEEDGGGSRKDHHHRRQYHHHQEQQQQQQQQSNHHARKRRRNNQRMSRQLHHKQPPPHQQQHRQQDIGSITTDAAPVVAASRQRGLSNNSNRGNNSSIKHHPGTTNTSSTKHNTLHQRNEAVNDVNLSNKKNGNTSNTNNSNSSQHGEQVPALVLEHAGRTAQWFCHGSRPLPTSSSSSTTTTEGKDNRPTTNKQHHNKYSYQTHLTEYEIKYYLCHLLIALDGLHAAGIMHRDVKPRNTLINLSLVPVFSSAERRRMRKGVSATNALQSTSFESSTSAATTTLLPPQPLMLVDLGLADFYLPGKEFNVRVASRHYKSPELLIGYEYYDYAIDMWSVGCILAGLLFRTEPFFRGVDNEDQLGRIVNCLGTRDFLPYCRKCNVRLSSKARAAIGKYCSESSSLSSSSSSSEDAPISLTNSDIGRRKPWLSYLTSDCPLPSSEATDLLDSC
ncbi:casein kinase II subunit alpha [Skeletonema marinoi]|uniref:non-specific serine/threonine protein kinase n=1 Tax=Skeletonema marinoi TaxID=267567 RepID=A0AAD9DEC9_9STRA|nr:casein kinase II subunit alpha [Skeletonema marinoi]